MKVLGIDTTTRVASVALLDDGRLVAEFTLDSEYTHSRRLLRDIDMVLRLADIGPKELDGVAVSVGPGSFTCLRVGVATVKGLALAAHLPVIGVSSLAALAENLALAEDTICPVLDARKREVYAAFFGPAEGGLKRRGPDLLLAPEALAERISEPVVLLGSGLEVYGGYFKERLGGLVRLAPAHLWQIRASAVARLGAAGLARGEAADLAGLAPLYLRASEAELSLKNQES